MDIKEFIKERITKNHLNIDLNDCYNTIQKYESIYPDTSEIKRFFHYVVNKCGSIVIPIHEDNAEILGFLKVRGKGDITFFEFEDEEDYLNWLQVRGELYDNIKNNNDLRIVNYVELSTMNFITDITTTCKYELIAPDYTVTYFSKTGFGTDQDDRSFIKFLGTKFKDGYTFKPIK